MRKGNMGVGVEEMGKRRMGVGVGVGEIRKGNIGCVTPRLALSCDMRLGPEFFVE